MTESPSPTMSPSAGNPPVHRARRPLVLMLRFVSLVSLLAFAAAVMPEKWIVETSEFLGFDPFPDSPLTFYLARHLSLMYGFVAVLLWVVAADLDRYLPLVRVLAWCTVVFGISQAIIDAMSGLPWWWTAGESTSTILGGLLLVWLHRRAESGMAEATAGRLVEMASKN